MEKMQYRKLIHDISQEKGFDIHSGLAVLVSTIELLLIAAAIWALTAVEPFGWQFWLLEFFLGTAMFRCFALLHECGHQTLFKKRISNTFMGSLFGAISLIPYVCWRDVHRKHHKWVGVIDKDPTSVAALNAQAYGTTMRSIIRIIWFLRLPIAAAVGIIAAFWLYPYHLFSSNKVDWKKLARVFLSISLTLSPWIYLCTQLGLDGFIIYVGPALFAYYFCFESINLCHHSGLYPFISDSHPNSIPTFQQEPFCRTATLPSWLSILCCYNFNFHTEHHLFPTVSWRYLPRLCELVSELKLKDYQKHQLPSIIADIRSLDPFDDIIDKAPSRQKQYRS